MSKTYQVIVKVGNDKFVKYNTGNLISFTNFVDKHYKGWRWFNPKNRGDSVRIYVADEPYVVVTKNCQVIGRDGALTGECLED